MEFKRISIDTSKHIFTLHGVDDQDRVTLRRGLRRGQVDAFFAKLPPVEIALEACAGAHHWGRVLGALGHRVKLIPPQYVKPFVKRSKNDRNDAEAISEAASRPNMRTVPVKTVDEQPLSSKTGTRYEVIGARLSGAITGLDVLVAPVVFSKVKVMMLRGTCVGLTDVFSSRAVGIVATWIEALHHLRRKPEAADGWRARRGGRLGASLCRTAECCPDLSNGMLQYPTSGIVAVERLLIDLFVGSEQARATGRRA